MELNFANIEEEVKKLWAEKNIYRVENKSDKPKYYVLEMFPYPSGAGLHVGHPLGYIASDIFARYKRHKGFNVLHPMGYDAFGLPAEQYAIETGQHPAVTTEKNIARYREQLDKIGLSYDWSREFKTSDPKYYKWTQWIFIQIFNSWYNPETNRAENISTLISKFERNGSSQISNLKSQIFSAVDWKSFSEKEQADILMQFRLAYLADAEVNWCEGLGTVLANDEVVNGVSERGGHPVVKKKMRQWFLRITEYADRLLQGLETLDWSEPMKEMQRNWIGRSEGALIRFNLNPNQTSPQPSPSEREKYSGTANQKGWSQEFDGIEKANFYTTDSSTHKALKPIARELRKNDTAAEDLIWQVVRGNQLGTKIRRQHVIGKFIVDFVSIENKLIIEIDGEIHEQQKEEDAIRTAFLNSEGFKVVRFKNEEVKNNLENVILKIKTELQNNLTLNPSPSEKDLNTNSEHSAIEALTPSQKEKGQGMRFIEVFTTRPDTLFGCSFMVLAPEHDLISKITTAEQQAEIEKYVQYVKSRSDVERMAEKKITGCFTGAFALHPFTQKPLPIYVSEYVLNGYGTGAIMAVPSGDSRDYAFAKHFNLPIPNIFSDINIDEKCYEEKTAVLCNSDFLNGLDYKAATKKMLDALEEKNIGQRKINFRMRDAGFSRQRYWGEPFPIYYENGIAKTLPENELPLTLPHVASYSPGPEGQGPLANLKDWVEMKDLTLNPSPSERDLNTNLDHSTIEAQTPSPLEKGQGMRFRETNTMPGYAGSSWYFLRYMSPQEDHAFVNEEAMKYWGAVDFYNGGSEHAVGHLLYSRLWTKVLHDLGFINFDEPFKKMVNQGMIQGQSKFVLCATTLNCVTTFGEIYISNDVASQYNNLDELTKFVVNEVEEKYNGRFENKAALRMQFYPTRVPVEYVDGEKLDFVSLKLNEPIRFNSSGESIFITNSNNEFLCRTEVEKMSKSKYNVVNPDDMIAQYGADTFRMYEMFLGPIELSKPWDTKGIEGVSRFLRKFWNLFFTEDKLTLSDAEPTNEEIKILHQTIKKIDADIQKLAYNTCVSQFMICVNELQTLKCNKRSILEPLLVLLNPFAPFITEYLWKEIGNTNSVIDAPFPTHDEKYLIENSFTYPIAINGKTRVNMEFALDADVAVIEKSVLENDQVQKFMEGKPMKKFIFVKGRMVNVVV
ncbi:MAG: hypothetical protein RL708_2686 [Bacteroidota bacterium]